MKGVPLTQEERQQIIDLRRAGHTYAEIAEITGRPYNTVAHILRDVGLQKEEIKRITLVHDPADIFTPGPVEWNQADLAYMLANSNLSDGFTVTIGSHRLEVQGGCYIRSDGRYCPPNGSGQLRWYKPKGAK